MAWLAVVRHLAGGSHAEDLGFTDQVLANFVRGQWFRMSIYQGATWNTELDLSHVARPDSLLAFHVEPMLLVFVPLYAIGFGATALLVIQALAVALGAVPAYRLGHRASRSAMGGLAVAAAYLLSPLGQWAVLSDFHTSTLAAPLLLLSLERLFVGRRPIQALLVAGVAMTAREDLGLAVVGIGLTAHLLRRCSLRVASTFLGLGLAWTLLALGVLHAYSGGVSPFEVRYGPTIGGGPLAMAEALVRRTVLGYVATLLFSGGWLGLFAPLALLPALPSLALNVLSTSDWMAAGKAHYSGLVLPFITFAAAAGLYRLRSAPRLQSLACGALVVTGIVGYVLEGAGPLGANYASAVLTQHGAVAADVARALPANAAVSATSSLVPHISERQHVYVFPAVNDADYVFLDLKASPAPTSAGDVYLRVQSLLSSGEWHVETAQNGVMLLARRSGAPEEPAAQVRPTEAQNTVRPELVEATLVPSPDGAIDVDGPRWILRTVWATAEPLPNGMHLAFDIQLTTGEYLHLWDIADLWWNPPDHWLPGQPVTIDVPGIPIRDFASWQASWSTP